MNKTASSERSHIVFIGKRNVGKSSLINRFIGQELVIVSEVAGTTTDPVRKAMELLPFGPVVLIDTAGLDDVGNLGEKRITKTLQVISEADFAVVILDSTQNLDKTEINLHDHLENLQIPFLTVLNKSDLGLNDKLLKQLNEKTLEFIQVSCLTNSGINELKEKVANILPKELAPPLIGDLVKQQDVVVLVVPIDLGAPKGRLIMPQVQTIREALDEDSIVVVSKDKELRAVLSNLKNNPKLVVTDSQAIMRVDADVPDEIQITTFSILMARYKGDLKEYIEGLISVEKLQNNDKILISEACSHHAQEDDIGKVKIPRWLRLYTKKNLDINIKHGKDFPENLSDYKLIVHCGGCMLTRRAMQTRIKQAKFAGVPIVNYGILISYMHGAMPRAIYPFEEARQVWKTHKLSFHNSII
ncbi:[FeFe] hydrogenase H-cluster maturation GTPase HydF [Bacteroidota bacterium]